MASALHPNFEGDLDALLDLLARPPAHGTAQDRRLTRLLLRVLSERGHAIRVLPRQDPVRLRLDDLDHRIESFSRSWATEHEAHNPPPGGEGFGLSGWRAGLR